MTGVIVNALAIIAGGLAGLLCRKGIPERISSAVIHVLGAYVLCIGIMGIFKSENTLVMLVSLVLGTVFGELLDIDAAITKLGNTLERRTKSSAGGFSRGFVTGTLLFCVGAMGIVGAIQAGTSGDLTTLFAKAVLDGVESFMLSASLGLGIVCSAGCVFLFEGSVAMLAGVLAPVLTDAILSELTAVGSLMILILGLNIMDVTKFKVANLLPALLFTPFLTVLFSALGIG